MSELTTVREALVAEALGEAGRLLGEIESQRSRIDATGERLAQASAQLQDALAGVESRLLAISEGAKTRTVRHIAQYTEEATRRAIEQQSRAMADAARIAIGAELGATLHRLQHALHQLIDRPRQRIDPRWSHAAALAAGGVLGWTLCLAGWPR